MLNINNEKYHQQIKSYITSLFAPHISNTVQHYLDAYNNISEIRLHLNNPLSFSVGYENLVSKILCTRNDINFCVDKMTDCNYSFFEEIIRNGIIPLKYGCRAGICGDAVNINKRITSIRSIDYINIRIPHILQNEYSGIFDYIKSKNYKTNALIISQPSVGKTSALREISTKLSTPPVSKRVCVVDTNRELAPFIPPANSLACYLSGYPKAEGIRIAVMYMNPQYILCDELGGWEETREINDMVHCGVPIIATAHANDVDDLYRKENIKILLNNNVFDVIIRLFRCNNSVKYDFFEL